MARFRLRFLLQEFDLVGPEILIGRSPECHITIEDPLVSREHARIRISGEEAVIEDLKSRNGVRVNGRPIDGESMLKPGDRLRLGTQELVFLVVRHREREAKTTGFLSVCGHCGTPYPEQAKRCPHCGAMPTPEQDTTTMSGLLLDQQQNWTFQLLSEMMERALASSKPEDAERLMQRISSEVDERIGRGRELTPEQLEKLSLFAAQLTVQVDGNEWISWALTLYRRLKQEPSDAFLGRLDELGLSSRPDVSGLLDDLTR